jgi:hypothetical protein
VRRVEAREKRVKGYMRWIRIKMVRASAFDQTGVSHALLVTVRVKMGR